MGVIVMILFLLWGYLMDLAKWYFDLKKYNIVWTFNYEKHNNNNNNIYLTIDDVINDDSFEEILDVLDEFNARATFFVISSNVSDQNKHLLSRAVKSGLSEPHKNFCYQKIL